MATKKYRMIFTRTDAHVRPKSVNVSEYALCLMPKLAGCSNVVSIMSVFNDELELLKRIAADPNGRIEIRGEK